MRAHLQVESAWAKLLISGSKYVFSGSSTASWIERLEVPVASISSFSAASNGDGKGWSGQPATWRCIRDSCPKDSVDSDELGFLKRRGASCVGYFSPFLENPKDGRADEAVQLLLRIMVAACSTLNQHQPHLSSLIQWFNALFIWVEHRRLDEQEQLCAYYGKVQNSRHEQLGFPSSWDWQIHLLKKTLIWVISGWVKMGTKGTYNILPYHPRLMWHVFSKDWDSLLAEEKNRNCDCYLPSKRNLMRHFVFLRLSCNCR